MVVSQYVEVLEDYVLDLLAQWVVGTDEVYSGVGRDACRVRSQGGSSGDIGYLFEGMVINGRRVVRVEEELGHLLGFTLEISVV